MGVVAEHPELININTGPGGVGGPGAVTDWIHANAISYNPELDQIAISSRHLGEIWIIDHSTTTEEAADHEGGNMGRGGDLLYRWGNPAIYNRGDESNETLWGQHNIQWVLEEGHPHYGKLLVFNNGPGRPAGNYSSLDIWTPPVDMEGNYYVSDSTAYGPTEVEWSYFDGVFFSANTSGVHALPNGNLFACVGTKGRFFEITANGDLVWEYINPVSAINGPMQQGQDPTQNAIFRATRYSAYYPAFEGKDLTPGFPIEVNPLPTDCVIYEMPVSVNDARQLVGVKLQNNPISNEVNLMNETGQAVSVEVFDLMGHRIAHIISAENLITLPAGNWPCGFYLLRVSDENRARFFAQKFIKN